MEITIYAKTKRSNEGKTFRVYLSRLTRKSTGEQVPVRVYFKEGLPVPTLFPCNIVVQKTDCNLAEGHYTDEEGETRVTRSLWVNKYEMGAPYEDHSLDDYE